MITTLETNVMEVSKDRKPCYPILFEDNFEKLSEVWTEYGFTKGKVCIVTDSNVEPLYGKQVKEQLDKVCSTCVIYSFPAGEESKNLETVQKLYEFLIENHFERKDMLVALGGGVVGDLTGFAAARLLAMRWQCVCCRSES